MENCEKKKNMRFKNILSSQLIVKNGKQAEFDYVEQIMPC